MTSINPAAGGAQGSATVNFRVLEGDVNGNGLVTAADLGGFLAARLQSDENAVVQQFRTWVRQQLLPPQSPRP